MRQPARNFLYVVLGFVCIALVVQGVGLKLPRVLNMLSSVSVAPPSSQSSIGSEAASVGIQSAAATEKACTGLSSIESSFNSAAIAEGNFIWFNSAIHVDGAGSDGATILTEATRLDGFNNLPCPLGGPAPAAVSFRN